MHGFRTPGALLTIVVLAVGACSAPKPDDGSAAFEAALAHPRHVGAGGDITLPFDAYLLRPDQAADVDRAAQTLAVACMRRFGLPWRVRAARPGTPTRGDRYGLIDPAEAERYGYHPPPDRAGSSPAAAKPGAEVMMVYFGDGPDTYAGKPVPHGGCLGESRDKLSEGAPIPLAPEQLQQMQNDLYRKAQVDARVRAVMDRWRECMRAAGYDYADIWRANNDPRWTAPEPTGLERATAAADVTCKRGTDLASVWLTVETAYQERAIAAQRPAFDAVRRGLDTQVRRAHEVLAAPVTAPAGAGTPAGGAGRTPPG